MTDAIRWSRLYGAAGLLLIARDGGELDAPLSLATLDRIDEIRVLDANAIRATDSWYEDPLELETYGRLQHYEVQPPGQESFWVHESRLIPVHGDPVPLAMQADIQWFGRSVLEGCLDDLQRYSQGLYWSMKLLERKQQATYAMEGLGEMFASGDDDIVARRINLIDQVRGNLNTVVVDKTDSYSVQDLNLGGITDLLDQFQTAICAKSNIPQVILFGRSTRGLNTTMQGDLESYYSMVSHIQQIQARPALEKLVSLLWLQRELRADIPDQWHIIFNPLWMPSEQEQATIRKDRSTADTNAVTNLVTLMLQGILSPDEVRQIVVNDVYSNFGLSGARVSESGDIDYAAGVDVTQLQAGGG
jgi:phage-related protein (TIGR01555 family)